MIDMTTTIHASESDTGTRWNSFGFDWGIEDPIVSERDNNFSCIQK
jgi:dTDP-4-dehydrorhamnose 3,5-epimerase-like enzyme